MSAFHCDYHQTVEDSDEVGFNEPEDGVFVCDDAMAEVFERQAYGRPIYSPEACTTCGNPMTCGRVVSDDYCPECEDDVR